jgi:hypothetical protein
MPTCLYRKTCSDEKNLQPKRTHDEHEKHKTNRSKESKETSIKQSQKHNKQTQTQETNLYISQYIGHFGDDVTLHIIVS